MRNKKGILFLIFLTLYVIGMCIGSARQVLAPNQIGMHEYLEQAITGYDVTVTESVKSIFKDNSKLFLCVAVGGFFVVGPVLLGIVMLTKGYMAGFAITAVLRCFGVYGLIFCVANLVSAAIVVPMLGWYSCNSVVNIQEQRYDRREFIKRFLVLLAIIAVVLLADCGIRGCLSAILMKFAPKG